MKINIFSILQISPTSKAEKKLEKIGTKLQLKLLGRKLEKIGKKT